MAEEMAVAPAEVTVEVVERWLAVHPEWMPETRRSQRSGALGFFRWAYKTGRISVDLSDCFPKIRQPPASPRPAPDDAWTAALAAADARTALMLRLAGQAGLRRSEVARLHQRDLLRSPLGAQLLVHGKGGKQRVVPISDALAKAIEAGPQGHTPGAEGGWLFPSSSGGHLHPHTVGDLVSAVLPGDWGMHTLRHRFATRAYRGSRNIRAVQMLLGHESVATTQRYTAVDEDEIRAAMMSALDT